MSSEPLRLWRGSVPTDWIDYNGHMSEGYYGLVFGMATDEVLLHVGFDELYRQATGGAFYTVETHTEFLEEINVDEKLAVDSLVVSVDQIRLRLFHELVRVGDDTVAAQQESMLLHVDASAGRVGVMREDVFETATILAGNHAELVEHDLLGKAIGSDD